MTKRTETPDLLEQLTGEIPPAPPAAKAEEQPAGQPTSKPDNRTKPDKTGHSKPAKRQASKPDNRKKPAKTGNVKPAEEPKLKATFYLSPSTLDALEAGWLQLRRLAVLDDRGKVSKSLIVEMSLLAALEELRDKDTGSQLASMMARQ